MCRKVCVGGGNKYEPKKRTWLDEGDQETGGKSKKEDGNDQATPQWKAETFLQGRK